MDRESARLEIRRQWRQILPTMTSPAKQKVNGEKSYICPICGHGLHGDGLTFNPDSKDRNGLKCFSCGFSGDIIDLYEQVNGADYNTALSLLAQEIGITIDPYKPESAQGPKNGPQEAQTQTGGTTAPLPDKRPQEAAQERIDTPADYTEYYKECLQRLNDPEAVSYLQARGISPETAAAHWIGYDPAWKSPKAIREGKNPPASPRLIIPTSKEHYIARDIRQDLTDQQKKYEKMNEGSPAIFNAKKLYAQDVREIFVVEGAIDALSIIETGGTAIALNSTNNADTLLQMLERKRTAATLILCLDNDEAGQRATETIKQGLERLNISSVTADINGRYKDPNEHLTGDRAEFENAIQKALETARSGAPLPGLLTYSDAVNIFETADDRHIELKSFPAFSAAAKIKLHDSVVIAADTGAGKSSLAINFLNDLNNEYPCIYINLEMDAITVLRRLTAIYSGLELDRIEGYKNDEKTAAAVNITLQALTSRKPLQVIQGAYLLQQIEDIVKQSIKGREEPTIVIIDHSLLVDTQERTGSRYDRFTQVSEGLRKMALSNNIILFVLLQQNRAGKATDDEKPRNSSLKESGSWENDATQICFLWYDPADRKKKLLLTKNRNGSGGEFPLNYWKKTQTYTEATGGTAAAQTAGGTMPHKQTKRERQKQKLLTAYETAYFNTFGKPTLQAIAEAADVTTSTVKTWIKEYGGFMVDGRPIDPAGIDAIVEQQEFIKLTPADSTPFDDPGAKADTQTTIRRI